MRETGREISEEPIVEYARRRQNRGEIVVVLGQCLDAECIVVLVRAAGPWLVRGSGQPPASHVVKVVGMQ